MGHTPLGYIIENGAAIIDEQAATKVKNIYSEYLSGLSLRDIAKKFKLNTSHAGIKKILLNTKYLGDNFYPQIIDKKTFDKAAQEMKNRATKLGRNNLKSKSVDFTIPINFIIAPMKENYSNAFLQAEYIYSLIESEVS